jgi:hypothetical protein
MFCHDTACNTDHKSRNCPILKKLGVKIDKRTEADNRDAASRVASNAPSPSPAPTPSANPPPPLDNSGALPGGFSAIAEVGVYDSGEEYEQYKGKSSGAIYLGTGSKSNTRDLYVGLPSSCCHTTADLSDKPDKVDIPANDDTHLLSRTLHYPQGVNTIYLLPKTALNLLHNPAAHCCSTSPSINKTSSTLVIADMGATDHMLSDKLAFISYTPITGRRVWMGNNSFASIVGHGTAIISLNNKKILIRDRLHIPNLHNPLYSLCAHQHQRGCGFIGMYDLGMHVFFPTFIFEVDTATNCHL